MVKVYSKTELSKDLQEKVVKSIQSLHLNPTNSKVAFLTDGKIISGIRIDINSEIYDLTLNSRLEKIFEILN